MHPKNNTTNFITDRTTISKTPCVNKTNQNLPIYDDYQYKTVIPKLEQTERLFHSQLFDPAESLKQQIQELKRQIKIKELSYDQIASAFYQSQNKVEELKEALEISEKEKKFLQNQIEEQNQNIEYKQFDIKQQQEIYTLFQNENTQLKLESVQLKDTILRLQFDNKQLKDQLDSLLTNSQSCERKGSSRMSFDYLLNDQDQSQLGQALSVNASANCDKHCNCAKRLIILQGELKKSQTQLKEKDQLIAKLTEQNLGMQKTQNRLSKTQKKQNLFGSPIKEQEKREPTQIKEEQNDTFRQLNGYMSDKNFKKDCNYAQDSQMPLKTSSSARSVLMNKSKKEVEQMYRKMNQSALFTASLFSTMLDYKNLHYNPGQFGNKCLNQIKQL
ncbi:unnamed protein product [Paramecium pentaurelia]|uniref:Uncharacterized protein n=1 Tax=Paramecium pentaurelia TaxID=43138 RepID=A0A8S1U613_9CILI|nr:unnamed protein product [Paramecium pentaurelia]